jgi:hypothetical protein
METVSRGETRRLRGDKSYPCRHGRAYYNRADAIYQPSIKPAWRDHARALGWVRQMRISVGTGLWRQLALGHRGSTSIWIAVMIPGPLMATAFAVEVCSWAAAQVALRRVADVSALAGGINYLATSNKQTAATFAARIAQLHGGSGTASPSWNSGTNTLTDNQITAQVITGYQNATDTALQVTVQKTIPAGISNAFSSTSSYAVAATWISSTGGQYSNDGTTRIRMRTTPRRRMI